MDWGFRFTGEEDYGKYFEELERYHVRLIACGHHQGWLIDHTIWVCRAIDRALHQVEFPEVWEYWGGKETSSENRDFLCLVGLFHDIGKIGIHRETITHEAHFEFDRVLHHEWFGYDLWTGKTPLQLVDSPLLHGETGEFTQKHLQKLVNMGEIAYVAAGILIGLHYELCHWGRGKGVKTLDEVWGTIVEAVDDPLWNQFGEWVGLRENPMTRPKLLKELCANWLVLCSCDVLGGGPIEVREGCPEWMNYPAQTRELPEDGEPICGFSMWGFQNHIYSEQVWEMINDKVAHEPIEQGHDGDPSSEAEPDAAEMKEIQLQYPVNGLEKKHSDES